MPSNCNEGNFDLNFFKNLEKLGENYGYLICPKCYGYYPLKENESLDDFLECECGSDLEFYENIDNFVKIKFLKDSNRNNSEILNDSYNGLQNVDNILKNKSKTAFHVKSKGYGNEKLKTTLNNLEREMRIKDVITSIKYRYFEPRISKNIVMLIIYLIALVAAEVAINYSQIEFGLILEVIILSALLINLSISESYSFSNLLRAMMVLPIIRIIGLSIPLMQIEHLYWFPIVSVPLFAAAFTLIKDQNLNRNDIGLVLGNIPLQLTVALSGVILGFTEYLILKPQPLISSFTLETVLIAGVILIISTGFAEELLFRGILQKNAENVLGKVFGLIYASLLFMALHIGWQSSLDLVFVFGVALFYGYIFQRTRSLLGITLSHGISNTFLFLVVPFIFPAVLPYLMTIF